jgi:hypothetical protein
MCLFNSVPAARRDIQIKEEEEKKREKGKKKVMHRDRMT